MRRVTIGPVVILICDPERLASFWLNAYLPEVLGVEGSRYPLLSVIGASLRGGVTADLVASRSTTPRGVGEA